MKTNVVIGFVLLFILGCKQPNSIESSYIKSLADSLNIETNNNILIYTINPNDCLSCINGFKIINNELVKSENSKLYVLSVDREIEKEVIIKSNPDLNLLPSYNKYICWSKEIVRRINHSVKYNASLSLIAIYNYQTDSILFCKPIREIKSEQEVKSVLIKNKQLY